MKIMKLRLFLLIILFINYYSKILIVDDKKNKLRELEEEEGEEEEENDKKNEEEKDKQKEDEDQKKYDDCEDMIAYEPTECFEIELDFKSNINKCCFLEYKDKKYENKRRRKCMLLTNEEFLDIKKTIKTIKEKNTNYTVLSLECDKSNILSLNNALFLILLLIPL